MSMIFVLTTFLLIASVAVNGQGPFLTCNTFPGSMLRSGEISGCSYFGREGVPSVSFNTQLTLRQVTWSYGSLQINGAVHNFQLLIIDCTIENLQDFFVFIGNRVVYEAISITVVRSRISVQDSAFAFRSAFSSALNVNIVIEDSTIEIVPLNPSSPGLICAFGSTGQSIASASITQFAVHVRGSTITAPPGGGTKVVVVAGISYREMLSSLTVVGLSFLLEHSTIAIIAGGGAAAAAIVVQDESGAPSNLDVSSLSIRVVNTSVHVDLGQGHAAGAAVALGVVADARTVVLRDSSVSVESGSSVSSRSDLHAMASAMHIRGVASLELERFTISVDASHVSAHGTAPSPPTLAVGLSFDVLSESTAITAVSLSVCRSVVESSAFVISIGDDSVPEPTSRLQQFNATVISADITGQRCLWNLRATGEPSFIGSARFSCGEFDTSMEHPGVIHVYNVTSLQDEEDLSGAIAGAVADENVVLQVHMMDCAGSTINPQTTPAAHQAPITVADEPTTIINETPATTADETTTTADETTTTADETTTTADETTTTADELITDPPTSTNSTEEPTPTNVTRAAQAPDPYSSEAVSRAFSQVQALTTAAAALQSPAASLSLTKLGAFRSLAACRFSHTDSLPRLTNPTGLEFGRAHGKAYRGTVIGNIALFAGVCTALGLGALSLAFARARHLRRPMCVRTALADLHMPSVLLLPAAICYQGTMAASIAIFVHATDRRDVGYGVFGAAVCAAVPGGIAWAMRVGGPFPCTPQPRTKNKAPSALITDDDVEKPPSRWSRLHEYLLWPSLKWVRDPAFADQTWKARNYFFFADYRSTRYVSLEFLTSLLVGASEGVRIADTRVCIGMAVVPMVMALGLLYLLLVCDVALVRTNKAFLVALNILLLIIGVWSLAELATGNPSTVTIILLDVAFFIAAVKTLVDLSLLVWWALAHINEIRKFVATGKRFGIDGNALLEEELLQINRDNAKVQEGEEALASASNNAQPASNAVLSPSIGCALGDGGAFLFSLDAPPPPSHQEDAGELEQRREAMLERRRRLLAITLGDARPSLFGDGLGGRDDDDDDGGAVDDIITSETHMDLL